MQQLLAKTFEQALLPKLEFRVGNLAATLGRVPKLVVVLVGDHPASQIYVNRKTQVAAKLGMLGETLRFPADSLPASVRDEIRKLNDDPTVDGILIQRPLPPQFNESEVLEWVCPSKDVDAFHPETVGKISLGLPGFQPCTPRGIVALLDFYGLSVRGKTACIVGRSNIVGKPLAQLLLHRDATIVQVHSKTQDVAHFTTQADFLFVAAGSARMVKKNHVKPGAVIVDVGIHRLPDGKICGDVDYEDVKDVVSAITPVPGGVGPMTILMLMENTVISAERKLR